MAKYLTSSRSPTKMVSETNTSERQPLLIFATLANATIWVLAIALLQFLKPTYTSKGAMILPGVGTQGNVSIPGLDIASTTGNDNQSPYSYLLKIDPRQNYQYIGMSDAVLSQAAEEMDMSLEQFGEPEIILGEGTTIIEFSIDGRNPDEAQQKANAFYKALVNHTDKLRKTQLDHQKYTTQKTIQHSKDNVREAQSKLSQFRSNSQLKTSEQIETLGGRLEEFSLNKADLVAQEKAVDSRLLQLEKILDLSSAQASDALLILDDEVIQKSLQLYATKLGDIQLLYSSYTPQNPQIVDEEKQLSIIRHNIINRGSELLNETVSLPTIQKLNLNSEEGRKDLVKSLLTLTAERSAIREKVNEIDKQINLLKERLTTLAEEQPVLNRLEQDVRLSESILVADAAKLTLNKPELATAYPFLQLLSEPSLPEEPDNSIQRTIVLGAVAASFLFTTGVAMFWWERQYPQISKSSFDRKK